MTLPLTRDSLGIFWNGEEVDGLLVYGLWAGEGEEQPPIVLDGWPPSIEVKATRMLGTNWTIWMWEIRVMDWPSPDSWAGLLSDLLRGITVAGAVVGWAGLEGMFVEPPDLFETDEMSGGVWAAVLQSGALFGVPGLSAVFQPLDDQALQELRRAVFADARLNFPGPDL